MIATDSGLIGTGVVVIILPVIAAVGLVIAGVVKATAEPRRKYQEWKKTLTDEQLTAVRLAEAAALIAAQHEVHKHVTSPDARARRQHIQDQIMHGGF